MSHLEKQVHAAIKKSGMHSFLCFPFFLKTSSLVQSVSLSAKWG